MNAQDFIFNVPLYQPIQINEENNFLHEIETKERNSRFDGYNPVQHKESTFKIEWGLCDYEGSYNPSVLKISTILPIRLTCSRYGDGFYILVYWDAKNKTIKKVGQYPSVADIHIGQIKQYKKVLPEESLKEFTRAIGLAANGIGIGSFVYLRRIFENLISNVAEESINEYDKADFEKARMNEKIEILKNHLPSFLVENKNIYGILSSGIHELSEEECLSYFDVMRTSIELILDQRLEKIARKEIEQKASQALNNISSNIKK